MDLTIALFDVALARGERFEIDHGFGLVQLAQGSAAHADRNLSVGDTCVLRKGQRGLTATVNATNLMCFVIQPAERALVEKANCCLINSDHFAWHEVDAVLRLDEVAFPPNAIAYRHIHPGPGIRYLTGGQLEIAADHDRRIMHPGDAWFEDAHSPVRATAGDLEGTAFLRAMVLPVDYHGKPTLTLLNEEDFDRPRLQTNTRFVDERVSLQDFCVSSK